MDLNFRIKLHLKYHSMNTSNACVYLLTVENRVIRVEMALVTAQVPCFQVFPSCISNLIGSPTWTPSLFFKLFNKVWIVPQMVKNLPAMWETQVRSLGREDPWRRKWQTILVLLPGESGGQRSLVGYSPRGPKSWTHTYTSLQHQLTGNSEHRGFLISISNLKKFPLQMHSFAWVLIHCNSLNFQRD